jgi:cell wall hydrolase
MREVVHGRAYHWVRALALLAVAVCALAFAAQALAASSPEPVPASPAAGESAAPAAAGSASPTAEPVPTTLTCVVSAASVVFGDAVTVTGVLDPVAEAQEVVVTFGGVEVGRVLTDAAGAYEFMFTPRRSGAVVAALAADSAVAGPTRALAVKPKASLSHGALVPFLPSTFVVKVAPTAYNGVVVLKVVHRKVTVGTFKARVRNGRAVFQVPLRGVDGFTLTFTLPAADGLAGRSIQTKVAVRAKTLSAGSSGPYVKGMLTALQRLRFRVPNIGTSFTAQVKDSVMAFQKAYRLSRTYVFNTECWRRIDGATVIKPRHAGPSTHIEVDKARQILMVVKGGDVHGIICVSTGATGNTPEGTFRIRTKYPYTTSGYGGILVRTMGFIGDFAIHGYAPVPPYPASHGCVREPIWACTWVYDQSFVGETLYIYH